jgi:hypothetical protein
MIAQLLEGIGVISAADSRKAMSWSENYQDTIMVPIGRISNNEVIGRDDKDEQDEGNPDPDMSGRILTAVEKASPIISTSYDLLI